MKTEKLARIEQVDDFGCLMSRSEGRLEKRNALVNGCRTSFTMEPVFWRVLDGVSRKRKVELHQTLQMALEGKPAGTTIAAGCRMYAAEELLRKGL